MKLTSKGSNFKRLENRIALARNLSKIIDPISTDHFVPYQPNETDPYYFVLDAGNNWRIVFDEELPENFKITYRYSLNGDRETILAAWLKTIGFCS